MTKRKELLKERKECLNQLRDEIKVLSECSYEFSEDINECLEELEINKRMASLSNRIKEIDEELNNFPRVGLFKLFKKW